MQYAAEAEIYERRDYSRSPESHQQEWDYCSDRTDAGAGLYGYAGTGQKRRLKSADASPNAEVLTVFLHFIGVFRNSSENGCIWKKSPL